MELFADHGVIVSPHGAGLVNELYLIPGSSVVEIFPYHFHHNLYPMLARNMGVSHFSVHTYNGSYMWALDKVRRHCMLPSRCSFYAE